MVEIDINSLASKTKDIGKKLLIASKNSIIRGFKLYYKPLEVFDQAKKSPDFLTPLSLLIIAILLHTAMAIVLMGNIRIIFPGGKIKTFIGTWNLTSLIILRFASIISLWFLSFIIFWFALYLMKITIDGFTVFSVSGYFLGSPFLIYAFSLFIYEITNLVSPPIYLSYYKFLQLEAYASATLFMKFYFAQKIFIIPLYSLTQVFFWYGTLWTFFLSVCVIKSLGEINWKKSIIGGSISMAIIYIIESAFHAVGML